MDTPAENKKIIFSGIQPTGSLHIGNHIGAIQQWIKMQHDHESLFCIVDLHSMTVPRRRQILLSAPMEYGAPCYKVFSAMRNQ